MRKKIGTIIVSGILMTLFFATTVWANPGVDIILDKENAAIGDTVTATIHVEAEGEITEAPDISLSYDAKRATFLESDVEYGGGGGGLITFSETDANISFNIISGGTIEFDVNAVVNGDGANPLLCEATLNVEGEDIAAGTDDIFDSETGIEAGTVIADDGESISTVFPSEFMPVLFHKSTTNYKGQDVESAQFDMGDVTLVYVLDENGASGEFKILGNSSDELSDFRMIQGIENRFIIILPEVDETLIPAGFSKAVLEWNGQTLTAFMNTNAAEASDTLGVSPSDFFLLYAISSEGNKGWFLYDQVDGTYQRYCDYATGAIASAKATDDGEKADEEENTTPVKLRTSEKTDRIRSILDSMGDGLFYVVIGVAAIFLIFLIVIIVLSVKLSRFSDDYYEDDDYRDNDYNDKSYEREEENRRKYKRNREITYDNGLVSDDDHSDSVDDAAERARRENFEKDEEPLVPSSGFAVEQALAGNFPDDDRDYTEDDEKVNQSSAEPVRNVKSNGISFERNVDYSALAGKEKATRAERKKSEQDETEKKYEKSKEEKVTQQEAEPKSEKPEAHEEARQEAESKLEKPEIHEVSRQEDRPEIQKNEIREETKWDDKPENAPVLEQAEETVDDDHEYSAEDADEDFEDIMDEIIYEDEDDDDEEYLTRAEKKELKRQEKEAKRAAKEAAKEAKWRAKEEKKAAKAKDRGIEETVPMDWGDFKDAINEKGEDARRPKGNTTGLLPNYVNDIINKNESIVADPSEIEEMEQIEAASVPKFNEKKPVNYFEKDDNVKEYIPQASKSAYRKSAEEQEPARNAAPNPPKNPPMNRQLQGKLPGSNMFSLNNPSVPNAQNIPSTPNTHSAEPVPPVQSEPVYEDIDLDEDFQFEFLDLGKL